MQCREDFYIKIKLGNPPKPFHFHVDTASGPLSWVYCNALGRYGSTISDFCTGATASLCLALQAAGKGKCDWQYDYDCLFTSQYFDGSAYFGRVVNGSITLPMLDKTERNVFGLFGGLLWTNF